MLRATFGALNWIANKAVMPALEKVVPQGAAEIGQALFTGQGYTPYGPTQQEVPIADQLEPSAHAPVGLKAKEIDRD